MVRIKNAGRTKKRKSSLQKSIPKQKSSECDGAESPHSSLLKTPLLDPIEESSAVKTSSAAQSQSKTANSNTIDEISTAENTVYKTSPEVPMKELPERCLSEVQKENPVTSFSPKRDKAQLSLPPPPRRHHPTIS